MRLLPPSRLTGWATHGRQGLDPDLGALVMDEKNEMLRRNPLLASEALVAGRRRNVPKPETFQGPLCCIWHCLCGGLKRGPGGWCTVCKCSMNGALGHVVGGEACFANCHDDMLYEAIHRTGIGGAASPYLVTRRPRQGSVRVADTVMKSSSSASGFHGLASRRSEP